MSLPIVNLFERISIESGEKIPLPNEVRQWAISKYVRIWKVVGFVWSCSEDKIFKVK